MTALSYHPGLCQLCGSDDIQKADEIMAKLNAGPKPTAETFDAYMTEARKASALRAPHMNRECAAK